MCTQTSMTRPADIQRNVISAVCRGDLRTARLELRRLADRVGRGANYGCRVSRITRRLRRRVNELRLSAKLRSAKRLAAVIRRLERYLNRVPSSA